MFYSIKNEIVMSSVNTVDCCTVIRFYIYSCIYVAGLRICKRCTTENVSSLNSIDEKIFFIPALEEWINSSMKKYTETNGHDVDYRMLDARNDEIVCINSWLYQNVETINQECRTKMTSFNDFCMSHLTP